MRAVQARVRDGRLELDVPADWPDGIEVRIQPIESTSADSPESLSAEEIGVVLAAMDNMEPFVMTDEEHQTWEADRHARKEREKARFFNDANELRHGWQ